MKHHPEGIGIYAPEYEYYELTSFDNGFVCVKPVMFGLRIIAGKDATSDGYEVDICIGQSHAWAKVIYWKLCGYVLSGLDLNDIPVATKKPVWNDKEFMRFWETAKIKANVDILEVPIKHPAYYIRLSNEKHFGAMQSSAE